MVMRCCTCLSADLRPRGVDRISCPQSSSEIERRYKEMGEGFGRRFRSLISAGLMTFTKEQIWNLFDAGISSESARTQILSLRLY